MGWRLDGRLPSRLVSNEARDGNSEIEVLKMRSNVISYLSQTDSQLTNIS